MEKPNNQLMRNIFTKESNDRAIEIVGLFKMEITSLHKALKSQMNAIEATANSLKELGDYVKGLEDRIEEAIGERLPK